MTRKICFWLMGLGLILQAEGWCAAKVHVIGLGASRREPYSLQGDPAGARTGETVLKVRPLVVDDKVKEWTTGEIHDITDRTFAVRRAIRLNDALPSDQGDRWVWQRGPWILIDRVTGRVSALRLPEFDSAVSEVMWFRDYAAYCGVNGAGKQVMAVVAQVAARKPLLGVKLGAWDAGDRPKEACLLAVWQRNPLRVTFEMTGAAAVSFDLVGTSAVLVEEDGEDPN
jgi:hypothetical protein